MSVFLLSNQSASTGIGMAMQFVQLGLFYHHCLLDNLGANMECFLSNVVELTAPKQSKTPCFWQSHSSSLCTFYPPFSLSKHCFGQHDLPITVSPGFLLCHFPQSLNIFYVSLIPLLPDDISLRSCLTFSEACTQSLSAFLTGYLKKWHHHSLHTFEKSMLGNFQFPHKIQTWRGISTQESSKAIIGGLYSCENLGSIMKL